MNNNLRSEYFLLSVVIPCYNEEGYSNPPMTVFARRSNATYFDCN
jgi:hypothetical protein